jgi:hypothetical protein
MTPQPESEHKVRQVVLPSGRTVEVVYFAERPGTRERATDEQIDLHLCGTCGSELVYPLDWEEEGSSHWRVVLRCPNCEWAGTGVFEQEVVERFDLELDRGTELLVADLQQLTRANMEDDVDRFVTALGGDHILPSDF